MKILITGASGLLGSHLVKESLARGFTVVGAARNVSSKTYIGTVENVNYTTVSMDLSNVETFVTEKFDVVINAAAFASPFEKDSSMMEMVNVSGVKNLYHWALASGVKKFIQISSIACFGSSSYASMIDESSSNFWRETVYGRTKKEADLWLSNNSQLPLLTIHPCYMLGEFDSRPSSGAIFFALKMGKFTSYINNTKNFVAASDVARGVLDAISSGASGNYILGGYNYKIKEFLDCYAKITGESISNITEVDLGKIDFSDIINGEMVKEFCLSYSASSEKAFRDFGYAPKIEIEEMIKSSITYFESKKMLRFKKR